MGKNEHAIIDGDPEITVHVIRLPNSEPKYKGK